MRTQTKNLKSVLKLAACIVFVAAFIAVTLQPSMAYAQETKDTRETTDIAETTDAVMETDSMDTLASWEANNTDKTGLREKSYYYKAFNRRDPFQSLIVGEFEETEAELVDIYAVKLVGVLSGGMDKYAMLEDKNGFGYIVKAGDPVRNGSIVSVGEQTLVARLTMFGQTNSVTLRLEGNKGKGE